MTQRIAGLLHLPTDPVQKRMVVKPVTFLGGTVLSFNASLGVGPTQESTLNIDIINDCKVSGSGSSCSGLMTSGEYFAGNVKLGSPVIFSVCEAMNTTPSGSVPCFEFGGILTNFTATQGSNGRVFNAKVVDPRSLLANAVVIIGNHIKGQIIDRNYFNVLAYYEQNILPTGLKTVQSISGMIVAPSDFTISGVYPSGKSDRADCSVFSMADSNENGMTYRKIYQALKEMKPLIFSPNYGEDYTPALSGTDACIANGKLQHQDNVMDLDFTGFPEPPPYYRAQGPAITILELLTNVCDALGREFTVSLERNTAPNRPPYRIIVNTKRIEKNDLDPTIRDNILYYDGKSIDFSYGKELRIDKTRTLLLGEQEHLMFESSLIEPFFGEDKDGNPIVAKNSPYGSGCGYTVDIEVDELNSLLNCPLFDPATNQIVKRKLTISEEDLRAALSSEELWKTRVLSSGIAGDFNKIIRYNFPEKTNELIRENILSLNRAFNNSNTNATNAVPTGLNVVPINAGRAFADAQHNANDRYAVAVRTNTSKDLTKVHEYLSNIGRTYYGKQFLVSLQDSKPHTPGSGIEEPLKVFGLPDGIYDDNFSGLGTGLFIQQPILASGCGNGLDIPAGKTYKQSTYSHVPTNAGGWVDPCVRVLGINDDGYSYAGQNYPEASLTFFREEDDRISSFARFETKQTKVQWVAAVAKPSGSTTTSKPEDQIVYESGSYIANACGDIDTSILNFDEYVMVKRSGGDCVLPNQSGNSTWTGPAPTGNSQTSFDNEVIFWVKADVSEKLYVVDSGNMIWRSGDCENNPRIPKAVIKFNNPILKRECKDHTNYAETLLWTAQALSVTSGVILNSGTVPSGLSLIRESASICGIPSVSGSGFFNSAQFAVDSSNNNSMGYHPAAGRPARVAVPIKSNVTTYGPWYSPNFKKSSGGIDFQQDTELAPWIYGSYALMEAVASGLVADAQATESEFETGSVNFPYWPELKLGFLDNGPNLTNITVAYGSNGINTNYVWQTYTPKFGNLRNIENQQMKEVLKSRSQARRLLSKQSLNSEKTKAKLEKTLRSNEPQTSHKLPVKLQSSLNRVLVGELYDWNIIYGSGSISSSGSGGSPSSSSGLSITGTGQRTVVGSETLAKSILELRYDYQKKAFISWDGLLGPVSISGDGGLPMMAAFATNNSGNALSVPVAPIPPVLVSGNKDSFHKNGVYAGNGSGIYGSGLHSTEIALNRNFLNPLTNNFAPSGHYHATSGAGHCIEIVGRNDKAFSGVPGKGIMNSFYGQTEWDERYSKDYRFLGLRGPLVLHSWGYDTQGKPIPNAIDDINNIKTSGKFQASGLKDEFYRDWLQKPSSWPVAPVDLRFDRERGVWVSPPQHKIVVAEAKTEIVAYGQGTGILINQYEDNIYGQNIYDSSGNLVSTNSNLSQANIIIEDRIGNNISAGEKGYAYFDTFSSKYLLLGGKNSSIRIGRFMNQWPSLGNVKEPMNAIKTVHLYKPAKQCPDEAVSNYTDKSFCGWVLEPEMEKTPSGTLVPKTVLAMNILANVAAAEYQGKWCMITQIDDYYYLLSAEC